MTAQYKRDEILFLLRGQAIRGKISAQTYQHFSTILTSDYIRKFDAVAEMLADELLKNTLTINDAYNILSSLDPDTFTTVNGEPVSRADIDRYNHYLTYLNERPNTFQSKKDFAFEVFGYALAHLT